MKIFNGCGLGLRREFANELAELKENRPEWLEITPENWIRMHASLRESFERLVGEYEIVAHGLSLSIGSIDELDREFLKLLKAFLDRYKITRYSEHLSFSRLGKMQSYELLPLPMTESMAFRIAKQLKEVQDILEREIVLENATYYHVPYMEMDETDFINLVLDKSGAKLLLDVNNVYVNSHNHKFDPKYFLQKIDTAYIEYIHVAGHWERSEDQFIDTHGMPVKDDVWELLRYALKLKKVPVLLERDNNIPPLKELLSELERAKRIYADA